MHLTGIQRDESPSGMYWRLQERALPECRIALRPSGKIKSGYFMEHAREDWIMPRDGNGSLLAFAKLLRAAKENRLHYGASQEVFPFLGTWVVVWLWNGLMVAFFGSMAQSGGLMAAVFGMMARLDSLMRKSFSLMIGLDGLMSAIFWLMGGGWGLILGGGGVILGA